jgi:hypothetical protein
LQTSTKAVGRPHLLLLALSILALKPGKATADAPPQFLWVHGAGGSTLILGNGVAVDAIGQVYLTGHFNGTASLGITNITDAGFSQYFLERYDFNGNPLWVLQAIGGEGNGVAVDGSGNVLTTGITVRKGPWGWEPVLP